MTHERQSFLAKRSASIALSLALTTGLVTVGAVAATPAAAASYTVGDGVQSLGIVATGANGGSATPWPPSRNIVGGAGAVVTTVLDSGFSVGDSIDTTVGTGGLGGPACDNGAGVD